MRRLLAIAMLVLSSCVVPRAPSQTGASTDSGPSDAGAGDAGPFDAGSLDAGSMDAGQPTAVISFADPAGETHVGPLNVTISSNTPATISYTTDGTSPATSATAISGPSPVMVLLNAPAEVTLLFYAYTSDLIEIPHSEFYKLVDDLQPASVSGQLFVPTSMKTGQAQVWLFDHQPTAMMDSPTQVFLINDLSAPGGAQYQFQGLPAGSYWIGAGWWPGAQSGNPEGFGLAINAPVVLDPAVSAMSRADFVDVYVGECDPAGTGIDGVVNVGPDLLSDTVTVVGFSQAIGSVANQIPVANAQAIGIGSARPFAMCGEDPGEEYILAGAFASGSSNPDALASDPGNPVSVSPVLHATFYLGESNPSLGGIGGTVVLNGPLTGGAVQVAVSSTPFSSGVTNPALVTATMTGAAHYAFTVPNLEPGSYYLLVGLKDAAMDSASFPDSTPVTVSGTGIQMVSLSASDGSISGTLSVTNVPMGAGKTLLVATPVGSTMTAAATEVTLTMPSPMGGAATAGYTLFGLPDGTYTVTAIVDENDDGSFTDDLMAGHDGMASTMPTIVAGGAVALDFSVALP